MQIQLNKVGKRYNRDWIFKNISFEFESGKRYAITGSNGSGKSTLLQVIAGAVIHNQGTIEYSFNQKRIQDAEFYKYSSIVAPYLEVIEEMTATEFLHFHHSFKKLILPVEQILDIVGLTKASDKQIRFFSSGMKQRIKMAQAFLSDTDVLFLDEPTTNLDQQGVDLYHTLIKEHSAGKTILVASNDKAEYDFCETAISIHDYK